MQIQQGMERLRTVAPEVFQSMGFPQLPPNLVPPAAVPPTSAAPAAAPASAANPTSPSSAPATGSSPAAPAPGALPGRLLFEIKVQKLTFNSIVTIGQRLLYTKIVERREHVQIVKAMSCSGLGGMNPNDPMFSTFMTQMLGQMRAGNPDQPPEERFASQLEQLASMGFIDRQQNIQGEKTVFLHKFSPSKEAVTE